MSKSQGKGGRGKQNLTFVRQVPRFLQHTLKEEPDISSKIQIVTTEVDDKPDEEYNDLLADKEEERPQIVVLNKFNDITEEEATKHFIKEGKLPATKEAEEKEVEKTPAVDKDGRILFRTKVKSVEAPGIGISSKSSDNNTCKKRPESGTSSKPKKAKKPKNSSLLSFEQD